MNGCCTVCQVEQLHSLARRSLATRQVVTGEYRSDDLPGGMWHHGATLDVCEMCNLLFNSLGTLKLNTLPIVGLQ